jgi:hypothetical protein
MLHFRNIVIGPFTGLLQAQVGRSTHCGGPLWPEWEKQIDARHCRQGLPVDDCPIVKEVPTSLKGTIAWGGPIVNHFGHQIADFSMRLLPTLAHWPQAVFAFATHRRFRFQRLEDTPPFFHEILDWFGIPAHRVILFTGPVAVDEVFVAPQAEQVAGPGPAAAHLDLLDEITAGRLGSPQRQGVLFVSRASIRDRFAGEAYLERALQAAGVMVIRPESLPLVEQLKAYLSASDVIFSEGSAVHATQLMGRALGNVHVLTRRPGATLASHSLTPRARSLAYHDLTVGLVHGLDLARKPRKARGLSILHEDLLLDRFANTLSIHLRKHWNAGAYCAARDEDVRQWLRSESETSFGHAPGSLDFILATLAGTGLAHFQTEVEQLWSTSKPLRGRIKT